MPARSMLTLSGAMFILASVSGTDLTQTAIFKEIPPQAVLENTRIDTDYRKKIVQSPFLSTVSLCRLLRRQNPRGLAT